MVLNSTVIYPQHCIRAAYVQTSHFVSHLAGLYIGCGYSGCGIGWGVCSELVNNPHLALAFILLSFYIICTYVDFDLCFLTVNLC